MVYAIPEKRHWMGLSPSSSTQSDRSPTSLRHAFALNNLNRLIRTVSPIPDHDILRVRATCRNMWILSKHLTVFSRIGGVKSRGPGRRDAALTRQEVREVRITGQHFVGWLEARPAIYGPDAITNHRGRTSSGRKSKVRFVSSERFCCHCTHGLTI